MLAITRICRLPLPQRARVPLRRRSLSAMLADEEPLAPQQQQQNKNHTALSSSTAVASHSDNVHLTQSDVSSYVTSSPFASKLKRMHTSSASKNSDWEQQQRGGTAQGEQNVRTSDEEWLARQRQRRELFAHQPKVLLKKSSTQYNAEVAYQQKQALLRAGDEVGVTGAASQLSPRAREAVLRQAKASVSTQVAVPLFPPQYLQRRAVFEGTTRSDSIDEKQAERLQLSLTQNHLSQSSELQPFRCTRCFTVFEARPSTLYADKVQNSAKELRKEQDKREALLTIAKRPSLRKKLYSAGRQRRLWKKDPTCCPNCHSEKVQWMMEYVHHKTHSTLRR